MSNNEMTVVKINSLSELEKIANSMVKSRLFGVENFDQAFSLMMIANARGIHPVKAAMDYHVIQGRPALKADAMLGYFQESGGIVQWKVYTDACVVGLFSHPRSGQTEPVAIEWTIEMASKIMTYEKGKQIPLSNKQVWKDYPRAMLRSRCISEGVRTVYPGIVGGFYTEEEVSTITENERFNNAKSVVSIQHQKSERTVIPSVDTTNAEPSVSDLEDETRRNILIQFTREAEPIRDEYRMMDADEGCNGNDWVAIHDKLMSNWLNLCDRYKKEYEWFVVPQKWQDGMSKMFGIEEIKELINA
jgi:hypothetical protein